MEIIEKLIERYKNMRSRRRLQECCVNEYSFVGFGGHSVDNLYPVLDYLHVPLKYILLSVEGKGSVDREEIFRNHGNDRFG